MRPLFAVMLSIVSLFAVPQAGAADANSASAPAPTAAIRIRAQCVGQNGKSYGATVVEAADNSAGAKQAAAEAACATILAKAAQEWDSACATYKAQIIPVNNAFLELIRAGLPQDDAQFAELRRMREEIYQQFPECRDGRPVLE